MSKLIVAAAAAAILSGVAGGAMAAEVGGWVESYDGTHIRLLDDPNVYTLAPSVDTANIQIMHNANLTYEVVNGENYVTALSVPSAPAPDPNADDLVKDPNFIIPPPGDVNQVPKFPM